MQELRAIKQLAPLASIYPWSIPTIVILGVASSLAEGLGITLFVPFLESLQPDSQPSDFSGIFGLFFNFMGRVAALFGIENKTVLIALLLFIVVGFKIVVSYLYSLLCHWIESHVLLKLRCDIMARLLEVEQDFWDTHKTGEIINTLTYESKSSSLAVAHFIWAIVDICTILVFGFLLLLISWKLTLIIGISFVIISTITRSLTRKSKIMGAKNLAASQQLHHQIIEALTGIKTVRAFGRQQYERERFDRASRLALKHSTALYRLSAIIEPLYEGLAILVLIGIMVIASYSQMTIPAILTFIFMLYRLQPQIKKLEADRFLIASYMSSVDNVLRLLKSSDYQTNKFGSLPFSTLDREISFAGVNFTYTGQDKPALRDIDLYIPKGKTTALVGHSGAGKSTIIDLIFGFYRLNEGTIYIDDRPLCDLNLADWRSRIAMVSQDVHLFNTNIRENIAYGKPGATLAEITHAAKQANADEFIDDLPQGYDTEIGDRGVRLSGGQKQRLSIARAILCDPDILILDEATNALDSISEQLIQESIGKLSQNRTVIAIAHRLSTIETADQIIVLDGGRVVEQGNFEYLIKLNGLFTKLYSLQHEYQQVK